MSNPRTIQERINVEPENIRDGDELININSFEYLANIAKNISKELQDKEPVFKRVVELCGGDTNYDTNIAYGDLYTQFQLVLENFNFAAERNEHEKAIRLAEARIHIAEQGLLDLNVDILKAEKEGRVEAVEAFTRQKKSLEKFNILLSRETIKESTAKLKQMDAFIDSVYTNENKALDRSHKMVRAVLDTAKHTNSGIEKAVRRRLLGYPNSDFLAQLNYLLRFSGKNKMTPQEAGSDTARLKAMLAKDFKPQSTTSLASVRTYEHQTTPDPRGPTPKEIRFGTQGQYHEGEARVNPNFENWLDVQRRRALDRGKTGITHIYFNNLGYDRTGYEGERERNLSLRLHNLEAHQANLAVITLPADKGLMDVKLIKDNEKNIDISAARKRMFDIASGNSQEAIKDFVISPKVKALLYADESEAVVLNRLLDKSFRAMGFDPAKPQQLSKADLQAVYFHFVKYEFTNFVIQTLQPETMNMSCKDAIDRGGVSSAYYNLMKSLEKDVPMSKDEFYEALHAAPTLVKGRGMNHHTQLIWNAMDLYIRNKQVKNEQVPAWMVEWRDKNAPPHSMQYHLLKALDYANSRDKDERSRFTIFSEKNKEHKVSAGNKLAALIEGKAQYKEGYFSSDELKALKDGRLGKIYDDAKKSHLVDLKLEAPKEQVAPKGMKV